MEIAAIITDDVVATLQPIWLKVPETAQEIRIGSTVFSMRPASPDIERVKSPAGRLLPSRTARAAIRLPRRSAGRRR